MDQSNQDGQDSSPIKPVSSLRSHFENMNKANEVATPPTAPPRPISPTPKSAAGVRDLRDGRPRTRESSPAPPPLPKSRPLSMLKIPSMTVVEDGVLRSPRILPPPPLSPKPLRPPPSVMIQPPQSPPKGRLSHINTGDHDAFLNPDSLATTTIPSVSARPFKIPSRPHTPGSLENRDLPRPVGATASNPPSPPPPRRSGEIRRDTKPTPPPINRAEKPSFKARLSFFGGIKQNGGEGPKISQETSPFSSPPSSAGSSAEEVTPPPMPTRPRPPPEPPRQAKTIALDFEPPPVHPSIASRRQDRDSEGKGMTRGLSMTPQHTGEQRPGLPSRPYTTDPPPRPPPVNNSTRPPPPRPPRPGVTTTGAGISPAPKRVVSTPTTQQPTQPPRSGGRSMTVDRTSARTPQEFRMNAVQIGGAGTAYQDSGLGSQPLGQVSTYPDASNTNRRPPFIKGGAHEIYTKYDAKVFDVCGQYICCAGNMTRVWRLTDGELILSLSHGEGVKATSAIFKPATMVEEEGLFLWVGTNTGDVLEIDVMGHSILESKMAVHGRFEVAKMYRHYNELWTLDDGGTLHVWAPMEDGVPSLNAHPQQTYRVPKGHTFSMAVGDELWHATGKEIRVFLPAANGKGQFQVLIRPLIQESAGEVSSGTLLRSDPDKVLFGHTDGKVSIYSRADFSCWGVISVSSYKINSLAAVGTDLWAGYNNGRICVYDMSTTPWMVKKEWQAHENPVVRLLVDSAGAYRLERMQVVSLGADNKIRVWDGFLQEDWLEHEMKAADAEYCHFSDIRAMIMTWNAGASTPHSLRYSDSDAMFIQNLLQSSDCPEILVFGFQELVDLEDKTATAKRLFKSKKKDKKEGSEQERMSHQYRDWRDFLLKSLDDFMPPDQLYHLQQTAHMVGLFTCIFVKSTIRDRIRNLNSAEIKRGLGGLHGNKGAVVVRFMVDDTSLCFVNCHLAAGQSQANARHNDIANILDDAILPSERDHDIRIDSYVGGGDGTMILDHELCLLNGDLNYRIDTMSRDTVVIAVKANNLGKLLERDQLLVAKRRNPTFRLRAFAEMPITFAPTYKYDVGTDNYDSSEKKRSPAWCDRILYRGRGRIRQLDYTRHEVRVSDHRPVSGKFILTVKTVDPRRRAATWNDCQQRFEDVKQRECNVEKMAYLMGICGYDESTSRALVQERTSRRNHRSPSRHRD